MPICIDISIQVKSVHCTWIKGQSWQSQRATTLDWYYGYAQKLPMLCTSTPNCDFRYAKFHYKNLKDWRCSLNQISALCIWISNKLSKFEGPQILEEIIEVHNLFYLLDFQSHQQFQLPSHSLNWLLYSCKISLLISQLNMNIWTCVVRSSTWH